ncbi:MAG: type II secretion system F family protein [Actinomycetota bacterium]|nr:type II secretion system F family protein [Actinomycetota bacterium]
MTAAIPLAAALGLLLLYTGVIARRERRRSRLISMLGNLLTEAGVKASPLQIVILSALLGAMSFVVTTASTSSVGAGVVCGAGAAWSPLAMARSRRARRRRRFREAWPDAIAELISGVRAGLSLSEACSSLADRGPRELRPGFREFRSSQRATGSFGIALSTAKSHLADPIADRVLAALMVAHRVGGSDLVRVLSTTANFVRDDLRVRKEIEARWSWTVTAARVAAASPWLVMLLMSTRPEAAAAYNSSGGLTVLLAGAVATAVGYRLMLRAARLPDERRLNP